MKNYLKFKLEGNQLLPVWLLLLFLYFIPNIVVQKHINDLKNFKGDDLNVVLGNAGSLFAWYAMSLALMVVSYAIMFYLYKMSIEGVEYKDRTTNFLGKIQDYLWLVVRNLILTIITFGIYIPWFMTDIYKFYVQNMENDDQRVEFKGKGSDLMVVYLSTLVIPLIIVLSTLIISALISGLMEYFVDKQMPELSAFLVGMVIFVIIAFFLMIVSYTYYLYKWLINFSYKGYSISFNASFWSAAPLFLTQLVLTFVTLGIYFPMAFLRIYKYMLENVGATKENDAKEIAVKKIGFELDAKSDFLFLTGQALLCIITLGIYFPWAYCKSGSYILSKTYVE